MRVKTLGLVYTEFVNPNMVDTHLIVAKNKKTLRAALEVLIKGFLLILKSVIPKTFYLLFVIGPGLSSISFKKFTCSQAAQ